MPGFKQVITSIVNDHDVMDMQTLAFHFTDNNMVSGSVLTVESNHFAVLKSRGAILAKYSTGQYEIKTPDHPILGNVSAMFFSGNVMQYEVIYINRAKLILEIEGTALSKEMAGLKYHVSAYIHVDTEDDAVKLIQHMPFSGNKILVSEVATYSKPVVEQAINQIVQLTPLEQINEKMPQIMDAVTRHLSDHFNIFGIHLNDIKATIQPADERMMEIISFQAIGLDAETAVRTWLAAEAIKRGLISAPNILSGDGFSIGGNTMANMDIDSLTAPQASRKAPVSEQ
jgi:membrane protease subunit (stomatin/prohibitin family)